MATWLLFLMLLGHSLQMDTVIEIGQHSDLGRARETASHSNPFAAHSNQVNVNSPEEPAPNPELCLQIGEDDKATRPTDPETASQADPAGSSVGVRKYRTIECPICLESCSENEGSGLTQVAGCLHEFCTACLKTWITESPTCPTCRGHVHLPQTDVPTSTDQTAPIRVEIGVEVTEPVQARRAQAPVAASTERLPTINVLHLQSQAVARRNLLDRQLAQRNANRQNWAMAFGFSCAVVATYFLVEYVGYLTHNKHLYHPGT
ncbi:hypothetical protein, variant [Puccinia triticina 1-1 BBBD Race 1]|uniref:RING-type domain-containing protein n=1 Tax=Puccinia triticina (isolate 1-1 / race 1 (BBBD)) TaxID=630390 RepID=A0A180G4U7_PUCT1|nr:hypothetical protein, variant [Puccinia triticina 1-1 BBBD Race 1]WAR59764.1 hypothetical protein PtB15_11B405 [Puccinia triticina]